MTRESIIDVSRAFFFEILLPVLRREFPAQTAQTAFGVFGYGSEVIGLDDNFSSDHHWGVRINAVMPDELFRTHGAEILRTVIVQVPETYRGYVVRSGFSGGTGLSLTGLASYLSTTIGIDHAPETYAEWLGAPEEDIVHVINGEIWLDEIGHFSRIRAVLQGYYPEPVRLRRIAHWCRYFSGMGTYALKRAILRHNEYYATITFARSVRWAVQLAFMIEKRYYPYDKWTLAMFQHLPRLAAPLGPLVDEAVQLATPWERKLELLNRMADVLDAAMVADGIIAHHPKFKESPTSGYRLLEHAYAEIIHDLPAELRGIVPVWEQIYWEANHSNYVASLSMETWDGLLNLRTEEK